MNRRDLFSLLGGAAVWPVAARAQAMPVIGYLNAGSAERFPDEVRAFRVGLREAGFVEGQNVAIEYRYAEGKYDRLPMLAADLVRRQVSVIATSGSTQAALAAKAETQTIPIVFTMASNPIEVGAVVSLSRPGSNLTGVTNLSNELVPKKLELLHEMVPAASTIAVLLNPTSRYAGRPSEEITAAAGALGLKVQTAHAARESDFEMVMLELAKLRPIALLIPPDAFYLDRREQLGALTLRYAIPAIYSYREFAAAGGLMAYGGVVTDAYRLVGLYTGRILKGERPGDLPVQQSTKTQLIINLKTAKALGLTVPLALLTRADEVIE
jgi:putative ABC transport system substrate-binding protein